MIKTKVLSVVSNPNERVDHPAFGLVKAVEAAVDGFISDSGGDLVGFDLAGTSIDSGAGSAQDPQAVFGRTLVVVRYEAAAAKKAHKKK